MTSEDALQEQLHRLQEREDEYTHLITSLKTAQGISCDELLPYVRGPQYLVLDRSDRPAPTYIVEQLDTRPGDVVVLKTLAGAEYVVFLD